MSALPEPGPARDRLVAEVVGWEWWVANPHTDPRLYAGHAVDGDGKDRFPSLDPADALAALEAWVMAKNGRSYTVLRIRDFMVSLYEDGDAFPGERAPTLPSAATAALLATGEGAS